MHRLAARTGFEIRSGHSHRRTKRGTISDNDHAAVIADIGPLMRIRGPRISQIEALRQMFVFPRDPGPQSERAIHMYPRALLSCRLANLLGGIERARIYVPSLNAHNRSEERRVGKECRSRW